MIGNGALSWRDGGQKRAQYRPCITALYFTRQLFLKYFEELAASSFMAVYKKAERFS
jgi:hypothetical protein